MRPTGKLNLLNLTNEVMFLFTCPVIPYTIPIQGNTVLYKTTWVSRIPLGILQLIIVNCFCWKNMYKYKHINSLVCVRACVCVRARVRYMSLSYLICIMKNTDSYGTDPVQFSCHLHTGRGSKYYAEITENHLFCRRNKINYLILQCLKTCNLRSVRTS
jgi:hypothetical protein